MGNNVLTNPQSDIEKADDGETIDQASPLEISGVRVYLGPEENGDWGTKEWCGPLSKMIDGDQKMKIVPVGNDRHMVQITLLVEEVEKSFQSGSFQKELCEGIEVNDSLPKEESISQEYEISYHQQIFNEQPKEMTYSNDQSFHAECGQSKLQEVVGTDNCPSGRKSAVACAKTTVSTMTMSPFWCTTTTQTDLPETRHCDSQTETTDAFAKGITFPASIQVPTENISQEICCDRTDTFPTSEVNKCSSSKSFTAESFSRYSECTSGAIETHPATTFDVGTQSKGIAIFPIESECQSAKQFDQHASNSTITGGKSSIAENEDTRKRTPFVTSEFTTQSVLTNVNTSEKEESSGLQIKRQKTSSHFNHLAALGINIFNRSSQHIFPCRIYKPSTSRKRNVNYQAPLRKSLLNFKSKDFLLSTSELVSLHLSSTNNGRNHSPELKIPSVESMPPETLPLHPPSTKTDRNYSSNFKRFSRKTMPSKAVLLKQYSTKCKRNHSSVLKRSPTISETVSLHPFSKKDSINQSLDTKISHHKPTFSDNVSFDTYATKNGTNQPLDSKNLPTNYATSETFTLRSSYLNPSLEFEGFPINSMISETVSLHPPSTEDDRNPSLNFKSSPKETMTFEAVPSTKNDINPNPPTKPSASEAFSLYQSPKQDGRRQSSPFKSSQKKPIIIEPNSLPPYSINDGRKPLNFKSSPTKTPTSEVFHLHQSLTKDSRGHSPDFRSSPRKLAAYEAASLHLTPPKKINRKNHYHHSKSSLSKTITNETVFSPRQSPTKDGRKHSPNFDTNTSPSETITSETASLFRQSSTKVSKNHSPNFETKNSPSETIASETVSLPRISSTKEVRKHSPNFDTKSSPSETITSEIVSLPRQSSTNDGRKHYLNFDTKSSPSETIESETVSLPSQSSTKDGRNHSSHFGSSAREQTILAKCEGNTSSTERVDLLSITGVASKHTVKLTNLIRKAPVQPIINPKCIEFVNHPKMDISDLVNFRSVKCSKTEASAKWGAEEVQSVTCGKSRHSEFVCRGEIENAIKTVVFCRKAQTVPESGQHFFVCLCDDCYSKTQQTVDEYLTRESAPSTVDDIRLELEPSCIGSSPACDVGKRPECEVPEATGDTQDLSKKTPIESMHPLCEMVNNHLLNLEFVDEHALKETIAILYRRWLTVAADRYSRTKEVYNYLQYFQQFSDDLAKMLLHSTDAEGNNALHFAYGNDRFDMAEELLDNKYGPEMLTKKNKLGHSPLMICAISQPETEEDWRIVRKSLGLGNVNEMSHPAGRTALMNAASRGASSMVRVLLECGADVNRRDGDGSTALMYAAEQGCEGCAVLLLEHPDCSPLLRDKDGQTASSIAIEAGHKNIALLIYLQTKKTPYVVKQQTIKAYKKK